MSEILKKGGLMALVMVLWASSMMAIPAKRTTKTLTLTDGTTVEATFMGDENFHWWAAENGMKLNIGNDGLATEMSASEFQERLEAGEQRRATRNAARAQRLASTASNRSKAKAAASSTSSFTGEKKCLVILVNFKNKTMSYSQTVFDNMMNLKGYSGNNHIGSLHDYFYDQSYGELSITFDVVGPVTVANNYSYYGQNDDYGDDMYACAMVAEACQLADSKVDFSDYDWDGDGEVEQVLIIYAGYGENYGADSDTIWPHEWTLSSGAHYGDGDGALTLDGVTIDTYAVTSELAGTSGTTLCGIGTAAHEFSHCLGFPDTYDTSYGGGWGMGAWDLMDSGSYNGPSAVGEVPCGYTAYERWTAGWLEPTELKEGMKVSDMKPLADSAEAYILYNDNKSTEYYLLENRQSGKWYKYVEAYTAPSGMLITHIDYNKIAWLQNSVNNIASHQRMTIFMANNNPGTLKYDASSGYYYYSTTNTHYKGHLYPYEGNDSLTATSTPAATLYNKNSSGKYYMALGILDITQNSDGTMAFRVSGDSSTGIRQVQSAEATEQKVYNIFGLPIGDSIDGLAPGVYIVNGRKVVIK